MIQAQGESQICSSYRMFELSGFYCRSSYFGSHSIFQTKILNFINIKKGHFSDIKRAGIIFGRKVGDTYLPSPRLLHQCVKNGVRNPLDICGLLQTILHYEANGKLSHIRQRIYLYLIGFVLYDSRQSKICRSQDACTLRKVCTCSHTHLTFNGEETKTDLSVNVRLLFSE